MPGPARRGCLFVVVGPSGSGKDTLIAWLRRQLADRQVLFVRRTVTRPGQPGDEDHATLDEQGFAAARAAGAFAVSWKAHGLSYGVPASAKAHVDGGGVAVVNGARRALADFGQAFDDLVVLHIEVAPDILAARLAERGREDADAIAARLAEGDFAADLPDDTVHVDNSGPIGEAGGQILTLIRTALDGAQRGDGP